jgi:hypothetical protein
MTHSRATEGFHADAQRLSSGYELTINVPVIDMAGNVMILMRENPIRGPLEGVDPENQDFFGR